MSQFRPLKNFADRWLGPLKTLPTIVSKSLPQPKTMKTSEALPIPIIPIKTYGTGREGPEIYGALAITEKRAHQIVEEARDEAMEHEKEISVPILTFNKGAGSSFSSQMNGIGLTDPAIIRGVQELERRQKELFAPFKVVEIRSTSPIKTYAN